ncbi:MAG: PAS domain S-box protein, partial [Hydrogenophaga sp.]
NFRVGIVVWLTHSAVIIVVGVMVYHSRKQAWLAFDNQSKEMARRERTEMERDLSLERFGLIFRTNPLPMVAQSAHTGVILDVNPAFEQLYGHTKAAMVGKTDECLWAHGEERAHHLERLRAKQGSVKASATGKRADGSEFTAIIGSDISQGPTDRLLITTVTDISHERRLQAQLLSLAGGLVASTHEALFTPLTMHMAQAIEADTVVVSELQDSDRARTLAVWKSGRNEPNFVFEVGGTPCAEALEKSELCVRTLENADEEQHTKFLLGEGYRVCAGLALRSEDGTPIGLLNALWRHPFELPSETQALMTIFASRATAELLRLRSERALAQLNDTLEQRVVERTAELQTLNAELDSFAYSISHDLKSPLRAIDGFTQLLSERLATRMDPEERKLMDRILGATHRTANLMADLLALARVSQQPLLIERINLSMMAQEELAQCLAKHPRVNLVSRIELGLVVYADAPLTRLLLKSLIDNAVKYTRDQTHPLIEIGRAVNPPHNINEMAKAFFIRDNGAGFSMA